MLLVVKSSPDTPEGQRGFKLAKDMRADLVLVQNAVYFIQERGFEGFNGRVYLLEEDSSLRGLNPKSEIIVKKITYDDLVDLITGDDAVIGMF